MPLVQGPGPETWKGAPSQSDGEPPYDDEMEARVKALEEFANAVRERLARIETKLDGFENRFATKADLHSELHSATWKFVSWTTTIGIALVGAVYFIAKNVH